MSEDKTEATLEQAAESTVVTEETTPVKKPSTPTMDGPSPAIVTPQPPVDDNPNSNENRFRPSGITNPKYLDTRVRRVEPWQLGSYRNSLWGFGVRSLADVDSLAADPKKTEVAAKLLGACLVTASRPGRSTQLFRKGVPGVQQIIKELKPEEIASALKVACDLSGVFA